jgi:hypothetical protein
MRKKTIRLPKRITVPFLDSIGACRQEVKLFEELWPRGCEVTRKNILTALEEGLTPYYLMEEFIKYYGFITKKAWWSFYRAVLRVDRTKARAKEAAFVKCAGDESRFDAAVMTARRKANAEEATLIAALWRKAKKEVKVDDEDFDRC